MTLRSGEGPGSRPPKTGLKCDQIVQEPIGGASWGAGLIPTTRANVKTVTDGASQTHGTSGEFRVSRRYREDVRPGLSMIFDILPNEGH